MSEELQTPAPEVDEEAVALADAEKSYSNYGEEQTQQPEPEKKEPEQPKQTKQQNAQNAQRRINRKNERLQEQVNQLTKRIREIEGSAKPEDVLERHMLEREVNVYKNISNAEQEHEFVQRAHNVFGEHANEFLQNTVKWTEHLNSGAEPELAKYINRPYGFIVLNAWYKQMNNPALAEQWHNATGYEKGALLHGFYEKLQQKSQQNTAPQTTGSFPSVSGGRETVGAGSEDDAGVALTAAQNALQKYIKG